MTAPRGEGAPGVVYVVVLNWNGWRDTLPCLETALRRRHERFQIVVCDNASTDGSMARLVAWAEGAEPAPALIPALQPLMDPPVPKPVPKPVPHAVLTRAEA